MNNEGKEKKLGLLGTIFVLLSPVPYIGVILALAGFILLFISLYNFSKLYNDKNIFNKFLIGWIIGFVGMIIAGIAGMGSLIPAILMSETSGREDTIMAMFGLGIIFAILVFYVICVISSYFYKQSLELLAKYTQVDLFNLAGNIIFWGAIAIILYGVGLLVVCVGWIILAVAFYSIPDKKELLSSQNNSNM